MFTGLIDHCGAVLSIKSNKNTQRWVVSTAFTDIEVGESIAVNGTCLTALNPQGETVSFDISPETIKSTSLDQYRVGHRVNLERSLELSDRLGGHIVLGHVDQAARLVSKERKDNCWQISFDSILSTNQHYLVPKGNIAVDGISLTVNHVLSGWFSVMIIPHTYEVTNLSKRKIGDMVNLEFDYLVKAFFQSPSNTKVIS